MAKKMMNGVAATLMILLLSAGVDSSCTVCKDGRSDVPWPEKTFRVSGIPIEDCATLSSTASFLAVGSVFCDSIQSIGTLCGCPIPKDSCQLMCYNETLRNKELTGYEAADYIPGAPPGLFMTCESMEAVMHNYDGSGELCQKIKQDVGPQCGCGGHDAGGTTAPTVANDDNATFPPSVSIQPSPTPIELCSLCQNGETQIMYPNRTLDLGDIPVNNCRDLNTFAGLLEASSTECLGLQSLGGSFCGCPGTNDTTYFDGFSCSLCPNGEKAPRPYQVLDWFSTDLASVIPENYRSIRFTCGIMESIVKTPNDQLFQINEFSCMSVQLKSWICGCSPDWRPILLTWSYRISGMLSFMSSATIVFYILSRKKKLSTTYHQLVLGISAFDMVSSIAYTLVGVLAPYEAGFYLSRGNNATCTLQGFMIQLGTTSIFYNLALGFYFFFVIVRGWRENQFQKLRIYAHVVINMIGLALAAAAIPHFGAEFGTCYVLQPPAVPSWVPKTVFYTVPISLVMVLLTGSTFAICYKVYRQQLASRRWSARQDMTLSRRVFWQSFWYMMGFYFTFPILLFSYYWPHSSANSMALFVVVGLLAPTQGLINALVYFRRAKKSNTSGDIKRSLLREGGKRIARRVSTMLLVHHARQSSQDETARTRSTYQRNQGTQRTTVGFRNVVIADDHIEEEKREDESIKEFMADEENYQPERRMESTQTRSTTDEDDAARTSTHEDEAMTEDQEEQCIRAAEEHWGIIFLNDDQEDDSQPVPPPPPTERSPKLSPK